MQSEESSKKNLICEISHFTTFSRILVFGSQKRIGNLTATKIPHGIITKTKFIYLKTYRTKTARRAIISEICILLIFAFYNFCQNLGFQCLEEGQAALQLLLISRSIMTVPKLYKKLAVRAIFRKNYKLRNFTFYNFSQNLGFRPLEKDLTTLQLLRIHGIIIISKFVRRTTARAIFRKFSILRNFGFYNFCQNLGIQP